MHPLFNDLAQTRQGEELEAAAVRQDRPVPTHEAVQAAGLLDHIEPGAHQQVEAVGENQLEPEVGELLGEDALDRGLAGHRHEDRRGRIAVRQAEAAGARVSVARGDREELHGFPRRGPRIRSRRRPPLPARPALPATTRA